MATLDSENQQKFLQNNPVSLVIVCKNMCNDISIFIYC